MKSYDSATDAAIPASQDVPQYSAELAGVRQSRWQRLGLGGSIYTTIVQVLVYCGVVLVPLFYLPFTSSPLEYNKQMLLVVIAAVGLMAWLLGVVVNGKITFRTSPLDKGVLGILVATIVAAVFSVARLKSVFGLNLSLSGSVVSILSLTIFYFLALTVVQDRGRVLRGLFGASLLLALFIGSMQAAGWHILPGTIANSRAFNTVGTLSVLGVLAAIGLPLFSRPNFRGAPLINSVFSGVGLAISFVILAILNWWVFWVIALVGVLGMITFDSLNTAHLAEAYGARNRFALGRFVLPMIVVVLGSFLMLVHFNFTPLKSKLPTEISPSFSLSTRIASRVLSQRLLFGWGPENFSLAFDRFGAVQIGNSQFGSYKFFDGASEVLNMAVHGGVVMLLALLLSIWCIVQVIARFGGALAESTSRGEAGLWAMESSGTLAALVATTVALFLYPFNLVLFFTWYVLLVLTSLIIAGDRQRTVDIEEQPAYSLGASLGFIVALILVLSGVYFSSIRYIADAYYAKAVKAATPTEAMKKLTRAMDLNASQDQYLRDASQVALRLLRDELNSKNKDAGQGQRIQNLIATSVQLAQRAAAVQPQEPLNWSNLGAVYESLTGMVNNVEKLAEDAFRKAADLRPGDPTFTNQIGAMWLARADLINSVAKGADAAKLKAQYTDSLGRAEEAFKQAIGISPNFGIAIYNLGAVYDREGKTSDAIKQLEVLAPYNANDATLMFQLGLLYLRANQHDKALTVMQQAVLVAPQYANAKWYLALLLEEKGDITGAIQQLKDIQKDNADNKILDQKIAQLQGGQRAIPPGKVLDSQPLE